MITGPAPVPSFPASGSMSRKRVGSVTQRGLDSPLTPLDIQSIQMPSNPQNALALKTAALSSTKSLFQTCTSLRRRLRGVEDFQGFLEQPPSAGSLDVVSHMCHIFRLGSPLIHLYNLLIPSFIDPTSPLHAELPRPPNIEYDFPNFIESPDGVWNWAKRPENAKPCQKYIAKFNMAIKQRQDEGRWQGETWALHELWGQTSGGEIEAYDSTGLMKVLRTVEMMVDNLPDSAFSPISPNTPFTASSSAHFARGHMSTQSYDLPFPMGGTGSGAGAVAYLAATMNGGVHPDALPALSSEEMNRGLSKSSADANAFKSIEELVSSEKSYVNELEILVRCSREMVATQLISTETNHKIFSNLSKILDFHRKFLIKLETEYEPVQEARGPKAWAEGRWGRPFVISEPEFDCYGPFCANYMDAVTIINGHLPALLRGQELPESEKPCLHPERELSAFMIKPIQRITKYGLLLDAILHTTAKHDYPYRAELEQGAAAVKRIATKINEVTDFKAKQATVRELMQRVDDWKGHEVDKFGDLWLDDHFTVTKADSPRDYHVFLFDKMMLCCKEVVPDKSGKKGSKNSSMLRKDKTASRTGQPEKRKLALKGRIFVSNIQQAVLAPPHPSDPYGAPRLTVGWTVPQRSASGWHEDLVDSFVMIGKSEDTMKRWADRLMKLAVAERKRQHEASMERAMRSSSRMSSERSFQASHFAPPTPATEAPPFAFPSSLPNHSQWPQGDEDDESGFRSGRTTPSIDSGSTYTGPPPNRRVQSQQAIPPQNQAELRARALTEDQFGPSMTQWRSQQPPSMPPPLPRMTSAMSAMSTMSAGSDASFGNVPPSRASRSTNISRLDRAEEVDEETPLEYRPQLTRYPPRGMARAPSHGITPSVPYPAAPQLRNRSVSSPRVYQVPPVSSGRVAPHTANWPQPAEYDHSSGLASSSSTLVGGTAYFAKRMSGGKRSSGESHSTETSETSSQQSPATPYASVPGDLRGPTPVSRQNSADAVKGSPQMMLRVDFGADQFIIGVAIDINFVTLYQKVLKKARMSRSSVDQISIKWVDADDDEIAVKCDADIEAMFGECKDSGASCANLVVR